MSYIGNEPPDIGAYGVQSFDGGGTSFTLSKPSTTATVLLFIDGVRQTPVDAYSVSGVTLTTTGTTPSGTDNVTVQYLGDVVDLGEPSDDSVGTTKIKDDAVTTDKILDDAVTADKLANSINTEIAANTAKVTNATHTGDVTGATALTIATDAVDIAMLSATGTADATTFLRGDNSWAAAGGANTPSFQAFLSSQQNDWSTGTWTKVPNDTEVFDTDSDYDTSTYRFTPTTAGKYFFYGQIQSSSNNGTLSSSNVSVYKNGTEISTFRWEGRSGVLTGDVQMPQTMVVTEMNGSSDYIELWGKQETYAGARVDLVGEAAGARTYFGGFRLL